MACLGRDVGGTLANWAWLIQFRRRQARAPFLQLLDRFDADAQLYQSTFTCSQQVEPSEALAGDARSGRPFFLHPHKVT